MGEYVKINVAGKLFYTSKSTITSQDTVLSVMFSERWNMGKEGCVFIDRDAKHFDKILNFLRDGKISRPKTSEDLEEIKREAEFYCISGLSKRLIEYQKLEEYGYFTPINVTA